MINRVLVRFVAGCLVFGSVIVVELMSPDAGASVSGSAAIRPEAGTPPRAPGPRVDDLLATILTRPLFSPTRQPAARPDQPAGRDLGDVRLTGIIIEAGHHLAIFAVPDAKPMVRSEGEMINDWRLDSIAPGEVVLSGPAGTTTLQPKIDTSLARRVVAPPRPTPSPPQVAAPGPPTAGPPKPRSVPAVQSPGTPMSPLRPQGAPRERQ